MLIEVIGREDKEQMRLDGEVVADESLQAQPWFEG